MVACEPREGDARLLSRVKATSVWSADLGPVESSGDYYMVYFIIGEDRLAHLLLVRMTCIQTTGEQIPATS